MQKKVPIHTTLDQKTIGYIRKIQKEHGIDTINGAIELMVTLLKKDEESMERRILIEWREFLRKKLG